MQQISRIDQNRLRTGDDVLKCYSLCVDEESEAINSFQLQATSRIIIEYIGKLEIDIKRESSSRKQISNIMCQEIR